VTVDLAYHRKRADRYRSDYDFARRSVRKLKGLLAGCKSDHADQIAAQQIVQEVAQQVQQAAHDRIASVVTQCLQAVFDEPYTFRIDFERKRGRTEARLLFVRGKLEIDPLDAAGGGVIDVAAFALRVACLILSRPQLRRVLILDEPFAHVKPPEVLGPRICEMLEMLSREFDIQFIIIPSIEQFYQIGKAVQIGA